MSAQPNIAPTQRRRRPLAAAILACLAAGLVAVAGAPAQDLESQLDAKEADLGDAKSKQGVLSSEIEDFTAEIDQLTGEVAILRNREAIVQAELDETQARLNREVEQLKALREKLTASIRILSARLVEIYKSDQPDAITVILQADGFDDLLERYRYLDSIQEQDATIADRVHTLRDETKDIVDTVRSARDEIAARKEELERTRMQLEAREADLSAARAAKADALDSVENSIQRLEGDIGAIQADLQAQIQAAQAAAPATPALPAGPIQGESSSGFIWPVSGPVVSPFGPRWGRMHEGIDIAAPAGTPLRAVANGSIVLVQSEAESGGYGNFTCIDHGGGLASCYAHQSSFAITSGPVQQGDIIGYVGCTGSCFGDHVHFEVRVNGVAVDPMGYL
ncbi:MAG: murein hydrolase activator EnvC family protein [Solirubrobacterales bacterium]